MNWDDYIDAAVKVINRTVNSTTKYAPFFLLYGYRPFSPFERKIEARNLETRIDPNDEYLEVSLQKAREEARDNIRQAEEKWAQNRNLRLRKPNFKVGDIVYVTDRTVEVNTPLKLRAPKTGLFCIVREVIEGTYRVVKVRKDNERMRTINARMIFPYYGPKPKYYSQLAEKILNGHFDRRVLTEEEEQVWDVENLLKWEEMLNESERQQQEETQHSMTATDDRTEDRNSEQNQSQESDNSFRMDLISQMSESQRPISPLEVSPEVTNIVNTEQNVINNGSEPIVRQNLTQTSNGNESQRIREELREVFDSSGESETEFSGFRPKRKYISYEKRVENTNRGYKTKSGRTVSQPKRYGK